MPWLLTLVALTVVPLGIYIVSYAPWVELGNAWGLPLLDHLPGLPASTPGGQTLAALTESMYQYHDNLRAEHAASSPWWAWPLDLKPVWYFQERYDDATTGLIYDAGNLVIFWMGLAGMAFSAWAAWRRRSLSLAIVVIMWLAMWLPWARIDRATFQYHVYASLPFLVLALAYLLAELWHGPTRAHVAPGARGRGAGDHRRSAAVAVAHATLHPRRDGRGEPLRRRLLVGGDAHGTDQPGWRRGHAAVRAGSRRGGIPGLSGRPKRRPRSGTSSAAARWSPSWWRRW